MPTKLSICVLLFSYSLLAQPTSNVTNTNRTPENAVNIHELNTMLALGIIDVAITGSAVVLFYIGNGRALCSFGKSQFVPLVNGLGLVVSAAGARATGASTWIRAAGIFSTAQGVINVFRAYLGVWYHFYCGQPLWGMPEHHENFVVSESEIIEFDLRRFISPGHHIDVALKVVENVIMSQESVGGKVVMGLVFFTVPFVIFASGVTTLGIGLHAATAS